MLLFNLIIFIKIKPSTLVKSKPRKLAREINLNVYVIIEFS